ncbi:DUF732 domain-containing protein [Mycobacterium sp. 050272]|uniref:DUF732 domain-containing protein n=1 Tax=Mycobacteriaceae TaxID=1762 RepID=UPI0031920B03
MRQCNRGAIGASIVATAIGAIVHASPAQAVPAPEVEYTYDVNVRRHFEFPSDDAIGYGYGICDKVSRGRPYVRVMADVKADVIPNDEQAANYVVSNAVGILCPAHIWRLRNSGVDYQPPPQ